MKTIVLFPGSFKPPHKGHYNLLKQMLENADEGIVFISPKERDGLTAQKSQDFWREYAKHLSKPVDIQLSHSSPVRSVYEWVDDNKKDYEKIIIITADNDGRYTHFKRKWEEYSNVEVVVSERLLGLSGTKIRRGIISEEEWKVIEE